jgi:hypothetical protein
MDSRLRRVHPSDTTTSSGGNDALLVSRLRWNDGECYSWEHKRPSVRPSYWKEMLGGIEPKYSGGPENVTPVPVLLPPDMEKPPTRGDGAPACGGMTENVSVRDGSVSSGRQARNNNHHACYKCMATVVCLLGYRQQLIVLLTSVDVLLQLHRKLLPTCCSELSQ